MLADKAVNQVIMSFEIDNNLMTNDIIPHTQLHLARLDNDGNIVDLTDYVIEGSSFFGGRLDENDIYNFNVTRYFHELEHKFYDGWRVAIYCVSFVFLSFWKSRLCN